MTLAGMLIFRGGLLVATQKTGTIIISNDTFNEIGNGYIPDFSTTKISTLPLY